MRCETGNDVGKNTESIDGSFQQQWSPRSVHDSPKAIRNDRPSRRIEKKRPLGIPAKVSSKVVKHVIIAFT